MNLFKDNPLNWISMCIKARGSNIFRKTFKFNINYYFRTDVLSNENSFAQKDMLLNKHTNIERSKRPHLTFYRLITNRLKPKKKLFLACLKSPITDRVLLLTLCTTSSSILRNTKCVLCSSYGQLYICSNILVNHALLGLYS